MQSLLHPLHRKGKADDPGGANPNLSLTNPQRRSDGLGHLARIRDSRNSGAGIRIPAISDHGPQVHRPEVSLGHLDGCSLDAISSEGPCGDAGVVGIDESKVIAGIANLLDATADCSTSETLGGADSSFYLLKGHSETFLG